MTDTQPLLPTDDEIDAVVQACRERGLREFDVFRTVVAKFGTPALVWLEPAPAPLSDDVVRDAARYRWLIDQHWIQTEVDWRLMSTDQDSTIKQLDAAIDAALAAQGGK